MRAGQLRNYVTVQTPTITQDSSGQPSETWSTLWTAWASIEPQSASEGLTGEGVLASRSYVVTMRYLASITPRCRISWGSRVLDIVGVMNTDERNQMLTLTCRERV
jgi:SPP1 family predicted phage head-tail adaptor